jgi:predicted HicB family RNase H-like nuclease
MGRIVPVRFAPDVLREMESKAKAAGQTLSEWIRSTLNAALNGKRQ